MFELVSDFTVWDWVKIVLGVIVGGVMFWGGILLMCLLF